jgi:AcrR family transcriptional regulator
MVAGEDKRARVHDALIDLCYERGYANVTVEQVCQRARVSESSFYEEFSDLEDCFCETLEWQRDRFFAYLDRALAGQEAWADRLRATAYGLLRYLRADRARTHFLAVELHLAGERAMLIWTETIVKPLLDRIDEGREESDSQGSLSRGTAEAVSGAVFGRIHTAAADRSLFGEEDIVPQLMYMAVLPYLGAEAAQAELSALPPPDPGLRE